MDEYLFISMAKLGADRMKAERIRRAAAGEPVGKPISKPIQVPVRREVASNPVRPTEMATRLATFSLLFAVALAAIGIGGGLAAALEKVPDGQVTVTELGPNADSPVEVKVAQAR